MSEEMVAQDYTKQSGIKIKKLLYLFLVLVVVIAVIIIYLFFFVNGNSTVRVGNGWNEVKGAAPYTVNGKVSFNFIGIEACEYCAAERYAVLYALSNFGNWTYYGKAINLSNAPVSNLTANPEPFSLFYHAAEGDWTFNFLNPHLSYQSDYVNFTESELLNNADQQLELPTRLDTEFLNRYDPSGSVPFTVIGGNFFEVGAGSSLLSNGHPIIFYSNGTGMLPEKIISAFNQSGSLINQGISKEADYISALICKDINNVAPACSRPEISRLEP
ncbi:DUF929 domain-containing protein [Candidatus Parvarchaeota archaeon]|nr:DUF929 domain-containing protein [Candidatus Parvarchaeota archaeon]